MATRFKIGDKVVVTMGLFSGDKGIIEKFDKIKKIEFGSPIWYKYAKLEGRGWYPCDILMKESEYRKRQAIREFPFAVRGID